MKNKATRSQNRLMLVWKLLWIAAFAFGVYTMFPKAVQASKDAGSSFVAPLTAATQR